MYPLNTITRFTSQESSFENSNHDENAKTGKKFSTVSSTSSTFTLSNEPHTAEDLWNLSRPPLESGAQVITDALFQRFLQGEIPDDHNDQLQIAETCLNHRFSSSLAWLFVKTEMAEFIYRDSPQQDRLLTLAHSLRYPGLPINSLVLEMNRFTIYDLSDIGSEIDISDSLKKINLSNTVIHEITLEFFKKLKGPNGDIVITGGVLETTPPNTPSVSMEKTLSAAIFSPKMGEATSRAQLKIQQKKAISAIEDTRGIKMENLSKVRVPDISEFSQAVQKALKSFFQIAYEIPYFMLHTTFSLNMSKILSIGSLTSRARLENFPEKPGFHGLKDTNDVANNDHRMIFAAMGTNANNIRPPSTFEIVKEQYGCSSFLIDVDLFMQNHRSARKHMMVKSCDWGDSIKTSDEGDYVTQIINIPNTAIKITRLDMDGKNGAIRRTDMIKYKYENGENGFSKEYALPVYGDIVTGVNYRQLVPLLFSQHLRQLDEKEQLAVLAGISEKEEGSAEEKRAVEDILEAFSPLEIAIPGSLPLQLEYVDLVKYNNQLFDFKAIRNAVQQGRMDEFLVLMEEARYLPGGGAPDWLINGIHRIAMKKWIESEQRVDPFLAILDSIEPRYQQIWLGRNLNYKPHYTSLDLLEASDELNALTVPPSRINRLILELGAKQEKVEAYLTDNRDTALESLNHLQEIFRTAKDVSELGLQSTLKAKVIGNSNFNSLVENKDRIKSLVYLASATPALIGKIFGSIDLKVFQAVNRSTKLDIIGNISGIRKSNSKGHGNYSFLSDLLFTVPCNSLFVPGNGMPDGKAKPFSPGDVVKAAYGYKLLFSALRDVLREENLIDFSPTIGEQLLSERYESGKWGDYKNRFLALIRMSKLIESIADGGEDRYVRSANDVILRLSVMDPEYSHFNLDPRHLLSVLAGNYGKAKPAFDELIETIAGNPEADENHRTTAIQLFHRMKLLEFEFYKNQLIDGVELGFDDYARKVRASMQAQ